MRKPTTNTNEHPLYRTWTNMRQRCNNPNAQNFEHYGGRGIKVCPTWDVAHTGFKQFLKDMGPRPDHHTLDRIDNDGPYSPKNCRWADASTQALNSRKGKSWNINALTLNGVTKSITDWGRYFGVNPQTLKYRMKKGMTLEQAGNPLDFRSLHSGYWKPAGNLAGNHNLTINPATVTINGITKTFSEWAKEYGIRVATLRARVNSPFIPVDLYLFPGKLNSPSSPYYKRSK